MMAGNPDPKPARAPRRPRRTVDGTATKRARLREDACAVCGKPGSNADHVIAKGGPHFGDDVPGNLIVLCGSGTSRCHGAKHGIPYVDEKGKRWTPYEVRMLLGIYIRRRRPDVVEYVLGKLGEGAGREWLLRRYYLEV